MGSAELARIRLIGGPSGGGEVLRIIDVELDAFDHGLGPLLSGGVLFGGRLGQLLLN